MTLTPPEDITVLLDTFSEKQLLGRATLHKQMREINCEGGGSQHITNKLANPLLYVQLGACVRELQNSLSTVKHIILPRLEWEYGVMLRALQYEGLIESEVS